MGKKGKMPDMNLPIWFDGQNINEALFCEEFLRERRIIFANGAFFTPDGRVTDDLPLRGEIYDKLKFCAVNNIPRKITNILEVLKLEAQVPDLETVTGQVEQAEQSLADAKAATEKQKKKLEALQKETKAAKTIALTVQDIEEMGKKNALTGNVSLTPDQCDTLKRYAVNGIIANADNKRLKEKLASAEKTISIWKQRYEAVNEKYMELKQKAQPFLDAIEIASERVWAFVHAILARGKETQEHKHPARKRRQDMEI